MNFNAKKYFKNKNFPKKYRKYNFFLILNSINSLILTFIFFIILLKYLNILFLKNFNNAIVIILLSELALYLVFRTYLIKKYLNHSFIIFNLILGIIFFISTFLMDPGFDSNAYHFDSIYCLKNNFMTWSNCNFDIQAKYFPINTWLFSSVFYGISNNFNHSHLLNTLLFICLIIQTFLFFSQLRINILLKFIYFLSILFNPVLIFQLFTGYNDSTSYCLLLILIFNICLILFNKQNRFTKYNFLGSFFILFGIKFNTSVLFGIIIIAFVTILLVKKKFYLIKKILLTNNYSYFVFLLLILLFSFHPYINNLLNSKHVFHPILGEEKRLWTTNHKGECTKQNRFIMVFQAKFAKADIQGGYGCKDYNFNDELFKISSFKKNFKVISNHDQGQKLAGFGPVFPLLLILSLVSMFFFFFNKKKNKIKFIELHLIFLFFVILVQISITPLSWVSRYVPFFWLMPTIIFIFFNQNNNFQKFLNLLFFILILLHMYFITYFKILSVRDSFYQNRDLTYLINNYNFKTVKSNKEVFKKNISKKIVSKKNIKINYQCLAYYLPYDKIYFGSDIKNTYKFIEFLKNKNQFLIMFTKNQNNKKLINKVFKINNKYDPKNELVYIKTDKKNEIYEIKKNEHFHYNGLMNEKRNKEFFEFIHEKNNTFKFKYKKIYRSNFNDGLTIISFNNNYIKRYEIFNNNICEIE